MKLTKKLLGFLHRIFEKDPGQFLALRLSYDGAMTWSIADGVLTTVVSGGSGQNLSVPLATFTISTLATYLAAQPGYSVPYVDGTELFDLAAVALLDGAGDINASYGDHLYGYTNWIYSYVDTAGSELAEAKTQLGNALQQMNVITAEEDFLDEQGSYFGVPRQQGELDAAYSVRMVQQILRPLANNVALQEILKSINHSLTVLVTDHDVLVNNSYGLFNVDFYISPEDLGALGFDGVVGSAEALIENARDAGTFLRALHVITQPVTHFYAAGFALCGETVTVYPG